MKPVWSILLVLLAAMAAVVLVSKLSRADTVLGLSAPPGHAQASHRA